MEVQELYRMDLHAAPYRHSFHKVFLYRLGKTRCDLLVSY
jgi:hypothetical protein